MSKIITLSLVLILGFLVTPQASGQVEGYPPEDIDAEEPFIEESAFEKQGWEETSNDIDTEYIPQTSDQVEGYPPEDIDAEEPFIEEPAFEKQPREGNSIDTEHIRETAENAGERLRGEAERIRESMPTNQGGPSVGIRQSVQERAQIIKQEAREIWANRQAEAKDRLNDLSEERRQAALERVSEVKRERIGQYAERMFIRMEASITRLSDLNERIEVRLSQFEEAGVDIEPAQESLRSSYSLITEAEDEMIQAETEIARLLGSENPAENFPQVRAIVSQTAETIRETRQQLIETVRLMRSSSEENDEETGAEE